MTTGRDVEILNGRLAASEEAGPDDVLVDIVDLLREAAGMYDARDRPDAARLLRRLASVFGDDTDLAEVDIDSLMASANPVELVTPTALAQHVTRSIFALKTPSPDGSRHYQSGWDDGLEAAMGAAGDAVLELFKREEES